MRARILARRELLVLLAILALAALLRLPGLDQRGRWDADQGHDMLVLRALVTQGEVPLLGPPTSIGTFHHGALYYYLLAPAAAVSNADPVAVTGEIALIGIGAVAATWWLARLVGGPAAGLLAGLLAAVSPAGIDESTFIWNPNLVPLAAALAVGGAVRAWQTRRARWWLLAAAGAMAASQLHVLGIVLLPPLVVAFLADLRRGGRTPGGLHRPLALVGIAGLVILAAGYVPLVIHELGHDFSETRAIVGYVADSGRGSEIGIAGRLALVGLRSVAWPLTGLITDRPGASGIAVLVAVALMAVAVAARHDSRAGDRDAARGLAALLLGILAWSVVALAIVAPSLAVVTPGLPNDHYHAFLDPIVLALCGVGLARLAWVAGPSGLAGLHGLAGTRRFAAGGALVLLVGLGVISWPPATAEDGGWRLVDEAAARVIATEGAGDVPVLAGIPPFKSADALRFPLARRGMVPASDTGADLAAASSLVLVCDPLFDEVAGAPCGGPAEAAWLAGDTRAWVPVDGFAAGSRRFVWVYRLAAAP